MLGVIIIEEKKLVHIYTNTGLLILIKEGNSLNLSLALTQPQKLAQELSICHAF